jgi:hypothetical protein
VEIKTIEYEACFNLGNYENERLRFRVDIPSDMTPKEAFEYLRQKAIECAQPDPAKTWEERQKLERELRNLQKKCEEARKNWEAAANFLTAQGLKSEMPNFPQMTNLLPSPVEEAEIIDF